MKRAFVGRALDVLSEYNELGFDVLGVQETWRAGLTILIDAGFVIYCSGESGGDSKRKGQGGVGLAVRTGLICATSRPPEFISDRLLNDVRTVWSCESCDLCHRFCSDGDSRQ